MNDKGTMAFYILLVFFILLHVVLLCLIRLAKKSESKILFPIAIIVYIPVLFYSIIFWQMVIGESGGVERSHRISCTSNLKVIGISLHMYSNDYKGFFPPPDGANGLEMLRRMEYLEDGNRYLCPTKFAYEYKIPIPLTDNNVSYIYRGGLKETDGNNTPICWDKPDNHKSYGNILYIDGHVEHFSGKDWMKNIKLTSDNETDRPNR